MAAATRACRSSFVMRGRWDWASFSIRTPVLSATAVRGTVCVVGVSEGVSSSDQVMGRIAIPPMRAKHATSARGMPRQGRIRSLRHSIRGHTSLSPAFYALLKLKSRRQIPPENEGHTKRPLEESEMRDAGSLVAVPPD